MYGNGDICLHRTYRSIGWVIVPKVAKVSSIRPIDISLDIEIFISLMDGLLYQKVARLLAIFWMEFFDKVKKVLKRCRLIKNKSKYIIIYDNGEVFFGWCRFYLHFDSLIWYFSSKYMNLQ